MKYFFFIHIQTCPIQGLSIANAETMNCFIAPEQIAITGKAYEVVIENRGAILRGASQTSTIGFEAPLTHVKH